MEEAQPHISHSRKVDVVIVSESVLVLLPYTLTTSSKSCGWHYCLSLFLPM